MAPHDVAAIGNAVARRDLLDDRERAVGGGDQRGAIRRDEAAQDRAAGLHELGGHHHVDIAGRRHQRQDRLLRPSRGGIISM